MATATRPRHNEAPPTPELGPEIRAQIIDAELAKKRRLMLDTPEEELVGDAETEQAKANGGSQRVTQTGRGKVTLWLIADGVPSQFLWYEAGKALALEERGKAVWTLHESQAAQRFTGTFVCYLNPAHPNFDFYHGIVGRVCNEDTGFAPKAGIPNAYQQREHMRIKHRRWWAAIEAEEARLREEGDRQLTRDNQSLMRELMASRTDAAEV